MAWRESGVATRHVAAAAGVAQKLGGGGYPKAGEVLGEQLGPMHGGYHDIDACPTLTFMIRHKDDPKYGKYLGLSVDKRPADGGRPSEFEAWRKGYEPWWDRIERTAATHGFSLVLTGDDIDDLLPDLPEPVSRRSGRRATGHHVALRRDTSQDVLRPEP